MQIREVMNTSIGSIPSHATLLQAIEQLRQQQTEALVVLENERPKGVVTEREIAKQVVRDDGERFSARRVGEVVNPKIAACYEDSEIGKVRDFTQHHDIHRLLVVNRRRQVVGVANTEDLG